jgi:hypothetical protein
MTHMHKMAMGFVWLRKVNGAAQAEGNTAVNVQHGFCFEKTNNITLQCTIVGWRLQASTTTSEGPDACISTG